MNQYIKEIYLEPLESMLRMNAYGFALTKDFQYGSLSAPPSYSS